MTVNPQEPEQPVNFPWRDDPWRAAVERGRAVVDAGRRLAPGGGTQRPGKAKPGKEKKPPLTPAEKKSRRRRRWAAGISVAVLFIGVGLVGGTYYVASVPTPAQLELPESTTVYFSDGKTPMAKLGTENRTILAYDDILEPVKQAIVAAEDQSFWSNEGVDFRGVLRAAWNNVTGGKTQGASTITQQYARVAADLTGVTYSRKMREAVMAWKLSDKYSKQQILEFYLNTVPFGRGSYGIEAAAQAFFGKSASRHAAPANQLTVAQAMVLVSMVKQPNPDPADPDGHPGYDPTRGSVALANSQARWEYVRDSMVKLGYLTPSEAGALRYPREEVKDFDPSVRQSGLDRPTGLAVNHVLSELRQSDPFRGKGKDYIQNGGFQIVTTIDKRAQDVAEAAANIDGTKAPEAVRGQPQNWQAALVAIEPGTGRVLAYYGGNDGTGSDYAGWYYDGDGDPTGVGQHPPGSSFKVYDLAEALRQGMSMRDHFDSPPTKEFPASGRTRSSAAGPVRNSSSASCQPDCALYQATVASLNTTFFGLTEKLGVANVIDMAIRAGVDAIWANRDRPTRIDTRGKAGSDVAGDFSTEVGIGQYGITVLDHANGMASFAAGGKRAYAHFVRSVTKGDDEVFKEQVRTTDIGLDEEQINQLDWTLSQVTAARLSNGWDSAGKTGTWQYGKSTEQNSHTWMVGYTPTLAAAVWLGTTDGKALVTKNGSYQVFGANYPGPIWRQFMVEASAALKLPKKSFANPKFPGDEPSPTGPAPTTAPPTASPSPTPGPTEPTGVPTVTVPPTRTKPPTPTVGPTKTPLTALPRRRRRRATGRRSRHPSG